MQTYPDCYLCILRLALEAARLTGADEASQMAVMGRSLEALRQVDPAVSPSEVAEITHRAVREITGVDDPYRAVKKASTQTALALYPRLKQMVAEAADPLDVATRLSMAGNIIDVILPGKVELEPVIERCLTQPYAGDGLPALREALARVSQVLYLGDNAGETVFDRILIETLPVSVIYAVKSGPVLNDAIFEDAVEAGIDRVAHIVETGSDGPGTILSHCSPDFLRLYDQAELVIAKGQANYETLGDQDSRVFCLVQVKCPVIGSHAGAEVGSILIRQGRGPRRQAGRDG
jgi:hypothetical protein